MGTRTSLRLAPELTCFSSVSKLVIRTDSRYVKDNHTRALGSWRIQRWRNRDGRPVDNADLWKDFVREYGKVRKPKLIEWVKAHAKGAAKNEYNVRADSLAKNSARSPLSRREYRSSVRRKLAPGRTKPGSVKVFGQTLIVHITEVVPMRVQKTWKYRYQVVSADSADCNAIDWIYSNEQLRDGHLYEVRLNDDMKYPQILEVLRHIDRSEMPLQPKRSGEL